MPDGRQPFIFAPAKRQGVGLFVGVAGGTGSGKTFSALRLARGIAGPNGKIAAIDTEARRMSHYDRHFQFDVSDFKPPFRPERFAQAAEDAERAGYAVLVIDSFSLEWTGEGGVLEWHDEEKAKLGGGENMNMRAWVKPKMAHKQMISSFLQRRIPLVFCFRAEEKTGVGAGGKPVALGWTPVGDQRFMYELTTLITLSNEDPGAVNYNLPRKIQEQHLPFFPDGKYISEEAGGALAAWARGEDPVDKVVAVADRLVKLAADAEDADELQNCHAGDKERDQLAWLRKNRPELHAKVNAAVEAKRASFQGSPSAASSPTADAGGGQAAHSPAAAGGDRKSDNKAPEEPEATSQPATVGDIKKPGDDHWWRLSDSVIGQDARMKAIRAQFMEQAETVAEIDAITAEHAEFIAKLGKAKAGFEKEIADRRLMLGGGQ